MGIIKKIKKQVAYYIVRKAVFDTVKINKEKDDGSISRSFSDLKYRSQNMVFINDKIKDEVLLKEYDVLFNPDINEYYLMRGNICCFSGRTDYTETDKKMGLDTISHDFNTQKLFIQAFTYICFKEEKTAKKFIKEHCVEMMEIMTSNCEIKKTDFGFSFSQK